MKTYNVWYRISPSFMPDLNLTPENLSVTHRLVRVGVPVLETETLDRVFALMQGEIWSPNGEAKVPDRILGAQSHVDEHR